MFVGPGVPPAPPHGEYRVSPSPLRNSPLQMASLSHALNQTAALMSPLVVQNSPVGQNPHPPSVHYHSVGRMSPMSPSSTPPSGGNPGVINPGLNRGGPPTGNLPRIRYSNNSRRSPIQLSQTRISPYTIPRNSINSRTPEPLPETNDVSEEQVRR